LFSRLAREVLLSAETNYSISRYNFSFYSSSFSLYLIKDPIVLLKIVSEIYDFYYSIKFDKKPPKVRIRAPYRINKILNSV